MKIFKRMRLLGVGISILLISACSSVPKDSGVSGVQEIVDESVTARATTFPDALSGTKAESTNNVYAINPENALTSDQVDGILVNPLNIQDAELLSIQLNPLAKSGVLQVGVAEADYAQAGRLENPGFSFERFSSEENSSTLLFDIGGLFLMPLKRQVEARRLERARYEAAGSVIEHVASTRRAWINAVAEKQQTRFMERALESTETGNNLTRQMAALGHSGVIDAAQSEIFLSEMRTALAKQKLTETAARESLIRQLGLWGQRARALTLPETLPSIPESLVEIESVEGVAIGNRIDVQVAKINLESMAENLSLTRASPFLSSIELGPVLEKAEGQSEWGYELELRIPIFDAGGVQNDKARFLFKQAEAQAQAVAINAASSARTAFALYRSNWEIAKYYEENLLPLRRRVSQEQLLRYNGMLISVFDLLDDLRAATEMESTYVNSVRDFWLADTNLQQALTGSDSTPIVVTSIPSLPGAGGAKEAH